MENKDLKPTPWERARDFIYRFMADEDMVSRYPLENDRLSKGLSIARDRSKLEKALLEVDRLIGIIKVRKKDKYDQVASKLADMMITTWDENAKESIADTIRMIKRTGPWKGVPIKPEDLDQAIARLGSRLGADIVGEMNNPTYQAIEDLYIGEVKDIAGTAATFSLKDEAAMEWTRANTMYWIGQHYDEHLSKEINKLAKEILDSGMDRATAAEYLETTLGQVFNKSRVYWDIVSNHVVTRTREFGRISGYEKAKVEYLEIDAVMDHRTSEICKFMNGKIIPVENAVKTRDKLINSSDPEEAKEIAPWVSDKEVEEKLSTKKTKNLPKHLALPPYHARCRTRTVRSSVEEWTKQIEEEDKNPPKAKKDKKE